MYGFLGGYLRVELGVCTILGTPQMLGETWEEGVEGQRAIERVSLGFREIA